MIKHIAAVLLVVSGIAHVAVGHAAAQEQDELEVAQAIADDERDGLVVRCIRAETESGCAPDPQ